MHRGEREPRAGTLSLSKRESWRCGAALFVMAAFAALSGGCATTSGTTTADGQRGPVSGSARAPGTTLRLATSSSLVLPAAPLREAQLALGLPAAGSPDLPEFSRNDARLGSPPPDLVTANLAWRYTFDQQRINSNGVPNATYRQTYRSFERVER